MIKTVKWIIMNFMKYFIKFFYTCSILLLLIVSFSSIVQLYENRTKIKVFFDSSVSKSSKYEINSDDVYWANEIMNGGYILHFRHAERDKWIDVQMYDALESDVHQNGQNEIRYAENDYFAKAVCLNERGKVQAKAIGESLKYIGLPIGKVISSVSCRARQTADLAFGGYEKTERILVHSGPYNENEQERVKKLINLYQNLEIEKGKNAIVSSHNSVISCEMFVNKTCPNSLNIEEGGFYVLSKTDKGLRFEYEFHNFLSFNRVFYER